MNTPEIIFMGTASELEKEQEELTIEELLNMLKEMEEQDESTPKCD